MKFAIDKKTNQAVNALGDIVIGDHTKGKFLHILPRLLLPYAEIDLKSFRKRIHLLKICIPELNFDSEKSGMLFKASRPYPNINYVVFGDYSTKMGLYISLAENSPKIITIEAYYSLDHFDLYYDDLKDYYGHLDITHKQILTLEDIEVGEACYSTEQCMAVMLGLECDEKGNFEGKTSADTIIEYGSPVIENHRVVDEFHMTTKNTLKPLYNRFVFASEFENEILFRDKEQLIKLSKFNIEHEKNAIVEAPLEILTKAIEQSTTELKNKALPQDHTAMITLCQFWNESEEVPVDLRKAKSCQIFVRANNNDEYHDIDLQIPSFPITEYCDQSKLCTARIGEHFLILYLLGQEGCNDNDGWVETHLVNGEVYEKCGMDLDDFEIGYETLDNLKEIPDRYPNICLKK